MKTLSVFDVIGPIMIGPSSSHTAGALNIARMARKILRAKPRRVDFTLYGSFAQTYKGHGTDKALCAGILGIATDDERIRNSFELAREAGVQCRFIPNPTVETDHPNTVDIHIVDVEGQTTDVRGESTGGGAAVIRSINGIEVLLTGAYDTVLVKQRDTKGVLAHIARCMSDCDTNIASTTMYRKRRGDIAYTVLELDQVIDHDVIAAIEQNSDILFTTLIEADRPIAPVAAITTDTNTSIIDFAAADFGSAKELLAHCVRRGIPLSEVMLSRERAFMVESDLNPDEASSRMSHTLEVMTAAAHSPLENPLPSMGGLIGGEAVKLAVLLESGSGLCDPLLARATMYSLAVLETNASMGRIVAAPTAGSSGVLPGMLLALRETRGVDDDALIRALYNAGAIGYLIARNATVSGAEGGCQAEVGAASAMAASAAVELMGGTPAQCLAAAGNAIANLLGLVCDPIAGLVESPCQKRNAAGVANAFVSAQIALAGVTNLVDLDQTIEVMYKVGRSLPFELRESALGGMAAAPSACDYCVGRGL